MARLITTLGPKKADELGLKDKANTKWDGKLALSQGRVLGLEVKTAQAGKRHGMIKRTTKFIRNARGTTTLSDQDAKIVKKMMPYGD